MSTIAPALTPATDRTAQHSPPPVTVLMSVYRSSQYLRQAIDSVLTQTFSDFEFLILDDGADDQCKRILDATCDRRIKILSHANRGLTASLNRGIRDAGGRYLARMDADDIAMPNRLERQFEFMENHPAVVAAGSSVIYATPKGIKLFKRRLPLDHDSICRAHLSGSGGYLVHPSAMIRTDAVRKIGGYDESLPYAQDYDLWFRLARIGKLANINEPLLLYRIHDSGISQAKSTDQKACCMRILIRELKLAGLAKPTQIESEFSIQMDRPRWVIRSAARDGFIGGWLYASKRLIGRERGSLRFCFQMLRQSLRNRSQPLTRLGSEGLNLQTTNH